LQVACAWASPLNLIFTGHPRIFSASPNPLTPTTDLGTLGWVLNIDSLSSGNLPSFGIFYQVKIPSADNSLGSGRVDHSLAFLASKDLGRVRVDFNVVPFIAGSPARLNHNTGFVLSDSVAITRKLSLLTEAYGYTRLDRDNPAFSSAMAGLTYQLSRRLIVDGGADFGVSHAAPRRRVFAGFTYAITNVFSRAARSGVM